MDNLTFLALVTTPNPSDRPSEGLAGPLVEGCNNQYGCCEDGVTPANGPDQEGCPGKSKDADSFLYSWDGYTSFVENSVAVFPSTLAFEFGKTTQQHVLTYLLRITIIMLTRIHKSIVLMFLFRIFKLLSYASCDGSMSGIPFKILL